MIYLFENPDNAVSIIYDETTLTDELKQKGIAIEALPIPEDNGKDAILKCKKATGEVWYDYVDEPINETDRITVLEDAVAELILGGVM